MHRLVLLLLLLFMIAVPVMADDEDYPKWAQKFMRIYDDNESTKIHEVREIKKNSVTKQQAAPMSYGAFPQNNIDSSYIIPWMYQMNGVQKGPVQAQ